MLTADEAVMATRASWILWGSCAAALAAIVLVCVALTRRGPAEDAQPLSAMGEAEWSFSQSWATNITLVGALLGSALASIELPAPTVYLKANVYVGFNALFGIMTVLAPLVYLVFSIRPRCKAGGFLAAGGLTLWAVVGQIATLTYLLWEIAREGAFPAYGTRLLWGLLVCGIGLVFVYCLKTMYSTLKSPPKAVRLPL